jgi:hypothetical protein
LTQFPIDQRMTDTHLSNLDFESLQLAEPIMQQAFRDAGADVFLGKPAELSDLFEALTAQQ